jgi:hypothetical protein
MLDDSCTHRKRPRNALPSIPRFRKKLSGGQKATVEHISLSSAACRVPMHRDPDAGLDSRP